MKKYYFFVTLILPTLLLAQIESITSTEPLDLSAYGETITYAGEGEYEVFLSPDNILDKPIIVVDGFDTGDTRDINGIYGLLDFDGTSGTENLADQLRGQGFDVIILNFPIYTRIADGVTIDGGTDFIERNAMLLVELIDIINTDKALNSPDQNVIIGPSMGGLVARYALNYMEANSQDADTRLYISFDAPHLGANVPIGFQHQLNYLAYNDFNPVVEIQPIITTLLQSPASRQLLVDHFESHLDSGSLVDFDSNLTLAEPHPFRTQFETNINGLVTGGFPQNTRNVAIINGSGIGSSYFAIGNSGTVVTNGFTIVDTAIPVTIPGPFGNILIDVEIDINMTPAAGTSNQVSRFFAPLAPPILPNVESIAISSTTNFDGVDAAPGGLFDLSVLTSGISGGGDIATDFLAGLQIDKFSYIPSVSALALEFANDEIDWHASIDLSTSPFVNTYLPDNNEPHVQLTEANVLFALSEILSPPLSVLNHEIFTISLEKNPIENELVLHSNLNSTATIMISDLTGKIVYNSTRELTDRTAINVDLTSGFYILNVLGENSRSFTTKFIVNN